ncbi:MAG: alpha/beta hydrolase [Pseudomonadota bacterium]
MKLRAPVMFLLAIVLAGCELGMFLPPTPNLFRTGLNYPEEQVHPSLRSTDPRIFFVTDRAVEGAGYGALRSDSMAFGHASVQFGSDLDWSTLLARTRADSNDRVARLAVADVAEVVRFQATPLPYAREDGQLRHLPEVWEAYAAQTAQFQTDIAAYIQQTGNDRLLVYVHGFNNDFEDGLTTLANIWHYSGRQSVPIAFTWPAGAGGGPLGYFRDRDSGEFAIFHTKEFLRMLAEMPEVAQIDIIAHSRGNAVATNALRELVIEARARGTHPKLALKTGTLIMAAPDLDVDIVRQRLAAERFSEAFEQINLYINPGDRALRFSAFLTRSTRLGALRNEDFQPGELELLRKQALVHFIRVENVRKIARHGRPD